MFVMKLRAGHVIRSGTASPWLVLATSQLGPWEHRNEKYKHAASPKDDIPQLGILRILCIRGWFVNEPQRASSAGIRNSSTKFDQ